MSLSPSEKLLVSRLRALPEGERILELAHAVRAEPGLRARQGEILTALEVPGSTAPFSPSAYLSSDALGAALQSALEETPSKQPFPKTPASS